MTICAKLSVSPTKSDRSIDSVKHAPKSNANKENEDNTGNPVGLKSNCNDIKKVTSLQTSTITSPPHVGIKSATPKSSPDSENFRTEHQVVTSTKPLSKPLVLATRVTQVHTSPPPTENTRESSIEDQAKNCDEPDDEFVVAPKVSRLKAMFESSDSGSQAKDESCARAAKSAGTSTSKFVNMKSPRPSRASPKHPGSVVKSDNPDANEFDSSTAPSGARANTLVTVHASFHGALHYASDCLYEQTWRTSSWVPYSRVRRLAQLYFKRGIMGSTKRMIPWRRCATTRPTTAHR